MNGFWDKDQNSYEPKFAPFTEKTNKVFEIKIKNFAPFTPFLGKWEFSEKKDSCQFLELLNL